MTREKTHSVHAASRSLFPFLSVPSFESFHLSVLLSQHRLCRRWARVSHSNRRRYALRSGLLKRCMTWVRGMWLIRDPLHRPGPYAWVLWNLLGAGSTWSTRHPASHTTWHPAGDYAWHVALHPGRNPSRYTARHIPDLRAAGCVLQNLLSGFLSSNVYRGKVGGLEGV